jgi:glutathione S-transferase
MKVYGSRVSYYTGKLESYLRYKDFDYSLEPVPYNDPERIKKHVGSIQHPMVERDDGRWMSDTTPILFQLEKEKPDFPILPDNQVVAFIARLLEDYADEWLWRSAMHYRWSYRLSRLLLSEILTDELRGHSLPIPDFLKRRVISFRQHHFFVKRDGVNKATWDHVEQGYFNALDGMTSALGNRRFLLGNAPSLADFGLMAPMLRHFGQDPTPAEIMRTRAPAVYAWVARMWDARADKAPKFISEISADLNPLLKEACETHLEQLTANAAAFGSGQASFDMIVQGCRYTNMPVSRYRVWCLEKLREAFASLSKTDQKAVRAILPHGQAAILWSDSISAQSEYNQDNHLPFGKAINVYGTGTP